MIRWTLSLGVSFLIALVAFNNCSSGGFQSTELASVAAGNAQCLAKIISSAKPELFQASLCENTDHYRCDLRKFRAGAGHHRTQGMTCVTLAGFGEVCVPVTAYHFDTAPQQLSAEAEDLVEGGAYNRDEVLCYNTQITEHNIPLVQAEGESVAEALEKSLETCRQRSRQ